MSERPIGSQLVQTIQEILQNSNVGSANSQTDRLPNRAERLAQRFVDIRGLVPPIDVLNLLGERATVAEKKFPIPIDGLCLDLKRPGKKPRVWINSRLGHHRKRFTLAHELGHIIIPWHIGTIVDEIDAEDGSSDDYRFTEWEANRFAAELLMPSRWSRVTCERSLHIADSMRIIAEVGDVSLFAAALRAVEHSEAGYIGASVRNGLVEWSARTKGTTGRPPNRGSRIESIQMPAFEEARQVGGGGATYYWWKLKPAVEAAPAPERKWREILDVMLLDLPEERRHKAAQRLNAIVGLAIGRLRRGSDVESIYAKALEALQNRNDRDRDLVVLLAHPTLTSYVLARAHERSNDS